MRTHDHAQALALAELLRDVPAEVAHARRLRPRALLGAEGLRRARPVGEEGVRPEDVVDDAVQGLLQARGLERPLDRAQRLEAPLPVPEPAMHNEDLVADSGRQREPLECPVARLEHRVAGDLAELLVTHLVEPERAISRHLAVLVHVLVVAPVQPNAPRVEDLHGEEQRDDLELVAAAVDPIAVEDVGHAGHVERRVGAAIEVEQHEEVAQLPMDVAKDLGGNGHFRDNGLPLEDLLRPLAEQLQLPREAPAAEEPAQEAAIALAINWQRGRPRGVVAVVARH
mmetsp:Transcript_88714/g.248213  ORF Transcript_88714/g.248213 Transcript_88714/m.248213 type:complete len:284 (-) Transcript_88714:637-1488(-)